MKNTLRLHFVVILNGTETISTCSRECWHFLNGREACSIAAFRAMEKVYSFLLEVS